MDNLVAVPYLEVERDSPELIAQQRGIIDSCSLLEQFSDFPTGIMVMNQRRQILFCNDAALAMLKLPDASLVYGMRLGEGLDDCVVEQRDGNHHKLLDLKLWTKPLKYAEEGFIVVNIVDISATKRRDALERIFLHDVTNTAGSLATLLKLLDPHDHDFEEYLELTQSTAELLTDEILSHRVLNDAEQGTLTANIRMHNLSEICAPVIATYKNMAGIRDIGLYVESIPSIEIQTDSVLLKCVIANLLKNIIEASRRKEKVSVFFTSQAGSLQLSIQNPALIDIEFKANQFVPSFSRKGSGQGLGVYSARLYVEEYLHGRLSYISEEGIGTTFTIILNLAGQPVV